MCCEEHMWVSIRYGMAMVAMRSKQQVTPLSGHQEDGCSYGQG